MSKSYTYILGALLLSLTTLPGFTESAHAAGAKSSSSCDLELKLGSADQATCDFKEVTVNGKKVRGRVVVKKAKRTVQPERRWGDPAPAKGAAGVEEEFADIEIQTETECTTGCENGIRRGNPIYESLSIRDARTLNAFVTEKYKAAALELAGEGEAQSESDDQVKQCLVDTNGKAIPENRRLSCRTQMFATLTDDEREAYYDSYIKQDLQTAISSANSATRNVAMQMLEKLARNLGPSEYLKESVSSLHRFGKDEQMVDTLNSLPTGDLRRYGLVQYLTKEQQHFASRGMLLSTQYSSAFNEVQLEALTQDHIRYQDSLGQITAKHQQSIGQTPSGTQGAATPSRTSLGQGTYPGISGPAAAAPRTGVKPSPAMPPRQQPSGPATPPTAGGMGRMPGYGTSVR